MSARREWARDVLRTTVAISARTCRVCSKPIAIGEEMNGYIWREELGVAHAQGCGFFTPTADTWADREAVAAMRRLIEVGDGPVPASVRDAALARGLVRRVHSAGTRGVQLHPTPVGAALYRLLTQTTASSRRSRRSRVVRGRRPHRVAQLRIVPRHDGARRVAEGAFAPGGRMSAAVSRQTRSLADRLRAALLIAREQHEHNVSRWEHRVEDGFYSDDAVASARFEVEQSAALVEELRDALREVGS